MLLFLEGEGRWLGLECFLFLVIFYFYPHMNWKAENLDILLLLFSANFDWSLLLWLVEIKYCDSIGFKKWRRLTFLLNQRTTTVCQKNRENLNGFSVRFRYSEKATKICPIFQL